MKIKYDQEANATYIELRKCEFSKNKKADDLTILDLDEKGDIIGIDILDASKRMPADSLSKVNVKNLVAIQQ